MSLLSDHDRAVAHAMADLVYCNPFLPQRVELERRALGDAFTQTSAVWQRRHATEPDSPNIGALGERARALVETMRDRLLGGVRPTDSERGLYQDVVVYVLYDLCRTRFVELIDGAPNPRGAAAPSYREFSAEAARLTEGTGVGLAHGQSPEWLFACFFQVRRAFHHTFSAIAGGSAPVARLRARVWQSIFTHDLRRYQRSLFARMGDVTTLITGPSGAGKELVARAIGLSRFIPFDPKTRRFVAGSRGSFFTLNLSALSPTLIESELFGHLRGAFTGAVAERKGWLEVCPPTGTVFLDEIGEVDSSVQVKLLRVLETRTFQALGSSDDREFRGKTVAATNRDLAAEMRSGRFREDLYYRLCADTVVAPSLRERLADSPDELGTLTLFLAERLVGSEEAPALAREAEDWIDANLGADYGWPGNVRELSHCVSNVMIHKDYRPAGTLPPSARTALANEFVRAELSADEILCRYCTLVYAATGSYVAAAERTGLDRRTVKSRIDRDLLSALRAG